MPYVFVHTERSEDICQDFVIDPFGVVLRLVIGGRLIAHFIAIHSWVPAFISVANASSRTCTDGQQKMMYKFCRNFVWSIIFGHIALVQPNYLWRIKTAFECQVQRLTCAIVLSSNRRTLVVRETFASCQIPTQQVSNIFRKTTN